MTTRILINTDGRDENTPTTCADCGNETAISHLVAVDDLDQRIDAGGEVPAGQCPECGALAYIDKASNALQEAAEQALGALESMGRKADVQKMLRSALGFHNTELPRGKVRPILAVVVHGGLVQEVVSNLPDAFPNIMMIDYDVTTDDERVTMVRQSDGEEAAANISVPEVEKAEINLPELLKQIFE